MGASHLRHETGDAGSDRTRGRALPDLRPLVRNRDLLLLGAATLLVFGGLNSYTAFLITAPVLGIGAYAYSPLTAAMIPALAGDRLAGSAAGAVNAFWQLGSVAVPAVIGPVFGATHSIYAAFAVLAAGPLLGSLAVLGLRDDRPGRHTAPEPGHLDRTAAAPTA